MIIRGFYIALLNIFVITGAGIERRRNGFWKEICSKTQEMIEYSKVKSSKGEG